MESVLADVRPARPGVTHPSGPGRRTGFLSDVIVELGFIDAETSEWAVEEGRVNGKAVTDVLLDAELISEDQLSRATAELHGLDHVDLNTFDIDLDVARLISMSAARRYGAVPIAFEDDGTLLIALADPVDPLAVDDISVMTKSEVHPMVATPSSIDAVIEPLSDGPSGPRRAEEPQVASVHGRPEAERRAEEADAALAEIRGERDQERLRHQKAEQELRGQIESAKESTRRLEQRLSNVLAATAEIRAACEKLNSAEQPS